MSISAAAALLNRGSVFCANFEFGVPEPMWDALARTIVGADDRTEPLCPLWHFSDIRGVHTMSALGG